MFCLDLLKLYEKFFESGWIKVNADAKDLTTAFIAMVRKRKIIVYIATSADGFIARPDGSVDWLDRPNPKGNYGMGAFYKAIDTVWWAGRHAIQRLTFRRKA